MNNPSNSVELYFYFFVFAKHSSTWNLRSVPEPTERRSVPFTTGLLRALRNENLQETCKRPLGLSIGSASPAGKPGISSGETHCERICYTETFRLIS